MEYSVQELQFSGLTSDQIMAFCSQDQGDAGEGGDGHEIELSLSRANELLGFPVLYLHECMALTTGLNTDPRGGTSFLCPEGQGLPAADRLLADMRNGRLGFPLRRDEFVRWAEEWKEQLPEVTAAVLENLDSLLANDQDVPTKVRKNSREEALKQVARRMEEACRILGSQGLILDRSSLPGTKAPYVAYIQTFPEFKERKKATIIDYLDALPDFRWAPGRAEKGEVAHIFGCLNLWQGDIPG